ncbi:MAG: hypothetical protein IPK89_08385 [Sphingomonadales bacterium]|nr:hypothetical protein [Sphingomonadales bacterium]
MLGPVHIAFLEMVIDPVCSLVFEAETEEANIMSRPPRSPRQRFFRQDDALVTRPRHIGTGTVQQSCDCRPPFWGKCEPYSCNLICYPNSVDSGTDPGQSLVRCISHQGYHSPESDASSCWRSSPVTARHEPVLARNDEPVRIRAPSSCRLDDCRRDRAVSLCIARSDEAKPRQDPDLGRNAALMLRWPTFKGGSRSPDPVQPRPSVCSERLLRLRPGRDVHRLS